MIKVICDVCRKEILETQYRKVSACSRNSLDGKEYGPADFFLRLEQVHPACAKKVEQVVKEAIDKYLNRFST
ncbi:hypothetical protein ES703_49683 [subsurface metagenome]